ncbi:hypothetical protein MMC10_000917 [Thelotrema lepadinum]|nr:hypothetical protein [Thelotrema lepadinum]
MEAITSRVNGPLTKPFGYNAESGMQDVVYPLAGPLSFCLNKDGKFMHNQGGTLEALITMFRFLDYTLQSIDVNVASQIERLGQESESVIVKELMELMGLYWETQDPEAMVRSKQPLHQLCQSVFNDKVIHLDDLWGELTRSEC